MNAPLAEELLVPGFSAEGVTASYLGVWKRELWIDGAGNRDEVTTRYWLQTSDWHADLSIQSGRPDFSGTDSLKDCSVEQLLWLSSHQQGFSGVTRLHEDLCHWDRQYDSSLRNTPDIGRMQFEGDTLHETGVLKSLYERWGRLPGSTGGAGFAVKGRDPVLGSTTLLLVQGGYFMFMRERPTAQTKLLAIQRRLNTGLASREDLERFADFELSFGHIQPWGWEVWHSTLPWREHQPFQPAAPISC